MALNLADIEALFVHHSHYSGKPVTQLAHTLQTALLAEEAGADDERVPAALPHDLGHPVAGTVDSPTLHGEDGLHQFRAVPFLWGVMPDRVPAAIQRHMAAKRFLCATRSGYLHALSSDAHRSFALQGGGVSPVEADGFMVLPWAPEAVALRLWDDQAKQARRAMPPLVPCMTAAQRRSSRARRTAQPTR